MGSAQRTLKRNLCGPLATDWRTGWSSSFRLRCPDGRMTIMSEQTGAATELQSPSRACRLRQDGDQFVVAERGPASGRGPEGLARPPATQSQREHQMHLTLNTVLPGVAFGLQSRASRPRRTAPRRVAVGLPGRRRHIRPSQALVAVSVCCDICRTESAQRPDRSSPESRDLARFTTAPRTPSPGAEVSAARIER